MLFANPVSLARLTQPPRDSLAMPSVDFSTCRARIGRGGRLILSRCQPFSLEPIEANPPDAEDVLRPPPFDMTAPYVAAEAQYQQELQSLPKQQQGQGQRHASPSLQATKAMPPPQAVTSRAHASRQSPTATATDGSPLPQPSTAQPGQQQTRQQQQQHPQLIEMPSQPGASLNGPSPPKSKVCSQAPMRCMQPTATVLASKMPMIHKWDCGVTAAWSFALSCSSYSCTVTTVPA